MGKFQGVSTKIGSAMKVIRRHPSSSAVRLLHLHLHLHLHWRATDERRGKRV